MDQPAEQQTIIMFNHPATGDAEHLLDHFLGILAGIAARLASVPASSEPAEMPVQSGQKAA